MQQMLFGLLSSIFLIMYAFYLGIHLFWSVVKVNAAIVKDKVVCKISNLKKCTNIENWLKKDLTNY